MKVRKGRNVSEKIHLFDFRRENIVKCEDFGRVWVPWVLLGHLHFDGAIYGVHLEQRIV